MEITQNMILSPLIYTLVLIIHIIASCVAVGTVIAIDYLHLMGLRRHSLEKKMIVVYPHLSKIINISLITIIISGIILVINNPPLLSNTLFQLKMSLVAIVTVNGLILQFFVSPHIDKLIKLDKPFPINWLYLTAICGAISIVSWLSILILAFTKKTGYSWHEFLPFYLFAIVCVFSVAQFLEKHAHRKQSKMNRNKQRNF
jgi:hypothetical protein